MIALLRVSCVNVVFGVLFGFGTASIAGVLDPISKQFSLSLFESQVLVTTLVGSCFFGAAFSGYLAGLLGRRNALFIAVALAAAGYGAILTNPPYRWLLFARVLIGLSVGLASMVAPMFTAEAASSRHRGAVLSLFQLAVTGGILLAYAVPLAMTGIAWQLQLGSGLLIAAVALPAVLLVPESPRWLLARGRRAEARHSAERLGILNEIDLSAPSPSGSRLSILKLLKRGSTTSVLLLCSVLFILQNLSGIDGILYYAPRIFEGLGFSKGTAALTATVGLGAVNLVATVIATALVDRAGRRPLLITGSAGMVVGLSGVVVAQMMGAPTLGMVGLCIYIAAFAVSLGPLPYVLMTELFPSEIRDQGIAVASATSWLFNALIALTFLSTVDIFGLSLTFAGFTIVCILSLLISIVIVPETRGVSLELIEADVLSGRPLRRIADGIPVPEPGAMRASPRTVG